MTYKALRNITGDELIAKGTEGLTADDLGGPDSVKRLIRIGAIEKCGKAEAEPAKPVTATDEGSKDTDGGKAAEGTKEK